MYCIISLNNHDLKKCHNFHLSLQFNEPSLRCQQQLRMRCRTFIFFNTTTYDLLKLLSDLSPYSCDRACLFEEKANPLYSRQCLHIISLFMNTKSLFVFHFILPDASNLFISDWVHVFLADIFFLCTWKLYKNSFI